MKKLNKIEELAREIGKIKGYTPGPWHWEIHDYSLACLCGEPINDDEMKCTIDNDVMSISPCSSCQDSAKIKAWKWGRCMTPSEQNAELIALAPKLLEFALFVLRRESKILKKFGW